MLRVLLAKDLRRAWRNPLPWLINLAIPLCITGLIGLSFGGKSDSGALGRIRFAVVDEDKTVLSDFLRGAANQGEGAKYLEPVFLDREAAMRQINGNKISAVLIIPEHFTRNYLTDRAPVSLELIKNPAESIHPAVLEEMLGAVTTALNALARNFQSELPEWDAVFEGKEDYHKVSVLIDRAGDKLKIAKKYINPPLVSYEKETPSWKAAVGGVKGKESKSGPAFNLFAYLLTGMSAMFLLFLASNAMTDLHRELQQRTFERYYTFHQQLFPFMVGKVVFTVVLLLLCSVIMFGGGGLIFRIQWQQPAPMMVLILGYACFAAALAATLVALVPDERHAGVLNNITGMALALVGGCAFPPQQLPAFLREHISPLLPTYWFAETVRSLEAGGTNVSWMLVSLKLAGSGLVLIGLAALLLRRRFKTGLHA
ncbi:MAG: ABC transporter permease [Limisphaerales bacterium]